MVVEWFRVVAAVLRVWFLQLIFHLLRFLNLVTNSILNNSFFSFLLPSFFGNVSKSIALDKRLDKLTGNIKETNLLLKRLSQPHREETPTQLFQ